MNKVSPTPSLLKEDLDRILDRVGGLLEELRGKRLFVTGGTGFFGTWLHECLARADEEMALGLSVHFLTRDPAGFQRLHPRLATNPAFHYHAGDVRDFEFPQGSFTHIIHGATTSAEATFANEEPLKKFDTLVQGTRRVLDFALRCGAEKLLFTSSGCVYGRQPPDLTHVPETFPGAPDPLDPSQALGHAKRAAEFLCAAYARKHEIDVKILRGFCFVGPHLQMDIQYAIGNFIRDAMQNRPIRVRSDGTAHRSYLYAADLMVWLWTIFLKGQPSRPYNVGSERDHSIAELARLVRDTLGAKEPVELARDPIANSLPERYVPRTLRARQELGLEEYTDLPSAILRTASHCVHSPPP